jgi:ParB-like chromosome segregation protein Spo0J
MQTEIIEEKKINYLSVDALIPYANNSRTHDDAQIAQLAASIKEFGFRNPILVDGMGIIAGHGRLMAARKLGLKKIPTIDCSDMTETQKKAYIIADNKLALNSGWDNELLSLEISELDTNGFNLEVLGFNADELSSFINGVNFDAATEDDQGKLDELEPKWINCPHCGKEFDARQS